MYKFIFLLLFSLSAHGDDVTIESGFYTKHLPSYYPYNNDNNSISIQIKKGDWYFYGTKFDNSFYRESISLGSGYNFYSIYRFDFDILFGGATGYSESVPGMRIRMPCVGDICFYLAPRVSHSIPLIDHVYFTQSIKIFGSAVEVAAGLKYEF